jgi:hypothetical protein
VVCAGQIRRPAHTTTPCYLIAMSLMQEGFAFLPG